MTQETVDYILEQIKSLDDQELLQVHRAIQQQLSPRRRQKLQAFYRDLRASGLVKQIKKGMPGQPCDWQPAQVRGKPVSETILEERR